ncbi:hypothetical protein BJY52DRAFT_358037 [Lactarius psammicola]|nr:hypothetical protein BJY52DRAFT_358037 [Lactarius psammicola]
MTGNELGRVWHLVGRESCLGVITDSIWFDTATTTAIQPSCQTPFPMMPAGPTASSAPLVSSPWTDKMARLLLIPDNEESLVAPALVLKATDYWPRIFLHAVWRELQAGDNQGRRLLRVTYSGLDLVYMYEYPSAAAGERQVTQEDFTPELRLKQLLDTLGVRRFRVPPYACTSFVIGHIMHAYIVDSRVLRSRVSPWQSSRLKPLCNSRSMFNIDPQNSSITTFRFSSAETPYNDHSNAQTSSGFVLSRPLIERVVGADPLLNTADAHSETGDQYSTRIDEYAQEQQVTNASKPKAPFLVR